jgi:uncharacterized membrane protein
MTHHHRKPRLLTWQRIYDLIVGYFGTWQSITVIFTVTLGLVVYGLWAKIPASDGYWVEANLYYSVMAIFEAEIILMGAKRKGEVDTQRSIETRQYVETIEKSVSKLSTNLTVLSDILGGGKQ